MRERPEFVSKGGAAALPAMLDVFRNPHARNILLVVFIDNISFALTSSMVLYICTYILQQPLAATKFILAFMLPSFLLVPIWMPLARRFGKKYLYLFSILLSALAFGAMFNLGVGDESLMLLLGAMAGVANGCGMTIGPSIYADVIDYDELQTGQRKEGAYFAVWSFVWKSATGLVLMVIGVVLSYVGFVPNETQSEPVMLAMRLMFTVIPCFCYLLGGMVFAMFALNETAYQEMRLELDAKRAQADS
jgi:GPH family glycoside/pentoside/hexuronide:cation symporter